jgi:hypothetical protein
VKGVLAQKTLKGDFTTFQVLKPPTPNEEKILKYFRTVYPIWVSYKTIEAAFLPTMGTVKNRVRGLYQKGYLDKHVARDGTVRWRVNPEVLKKLRKRRAS